MLLPRRRLGGGPAGSRPAAMAATGSPGSRPDLVTSRWPECRWPVSVAWGRAGQRAAPSAAAPRPSAAAVRRHPGRPSAAAGRGELPHLPHRGPPWHASRPVPAASRSPPCRCSRSCCGSSEQHGPGSGSPPAAG